MTRDPRLTPEEGDTWLMNMDVVAWVQDSEHFAIAYSPGLGPVRAPHARSFHPGRHPRNPQPFITYLGKKTFEEARCCPFKESTAAQFFEALA